MTGRTDTSGVRRSLIDAGIGFLMFLVLAASLGGASETQFPPRAGSIFAMGAEAAEQAAGLVSATPATVAGAAVSLLNPAPLTVSARVHDEMGSRRADRGRAIFILGVAFSMLFALNMAFLRHLRRAYASPRRAGWRRG